MLSPYEEKARPLFVLSCPVLSCPVLSSHILPSPLRPSNLSLPLQRSVTRTCTRRCAEQGRLYKYKLDQMMTNHLQQPSHQLNDFEIVHNSFRSVWKKISASGKDLVSKLLTIDPIKRSAQCSSPPSAILYLKIQIQNYAVLHCTVPYYTAL